MSAEEILKLIEEVDPTDTAKLDEIDARVSAFVNGRDYIRHFTDTFRNQTVFVHSENPGEAMGTMSCRQYTRSRDALKAIRPNNWDFICCPKRCSAHGPYVTYQEPDNGYVENIQLDSPELPNEELSELHAIIQAIAYERNSLTNK